MAASAQRPGDLAIWWTAIRPKTLWASVAPVIVGTAMAFRENVFHWPSACAALCGAILIQVGTNISNDYSDFVKGADTAERKGPLRVMQAGLADAAQMKRAAFAAFAAAFLVGVYLVSRGGWPIVFVGVTSIAAGILYTGGPRPYGYRGWGDLFVFVFFGPVAVVGTYYVQALDTIPAIWIASIPIGALATAILIVNNMRDIDTDRVAGKMTVAVRLGPLGSAWEYTTMLLIAASAPLIMFMLGWGGIGLLIPMVSVASGVPIVRRLFGDNTPEEFNRLLEDTARLKLLYALAFAAGIILRGANCNCL